MRKLIDILVLFEAASGQIVNANKSSVFFSHNTPYERRCEVLNILGPMQDTRHSKYLGLPSIIGRSKTEVFAEVKEGVGRKLAGWNEKLLSIGRKGKGHSTRCFHVYNELLLNLERVV